MSLSSVTSYADGDPLTPAHLNSKLNPLVSAISDSAGAGGSGITGSGTANYVPIWSAVTTLGDSKISQSSDTVGVNGVLSVLTTVAIGSPDGPTAALRLPAEGGISIGSSAGYPNWIVRQDGSNQLLWGTTFGGGVFNSKHIFYSGTEPSRYVQIEASQVLGVGGVGALGSSGVPWNNVHANTITSYNRIDTKASVFGGSGLRIPHGTAPGTPVNGDVWTTTAGIYVQINGATVGPLGTGGSGTTITGSGTTNYLPLWSSALGLTDSLASQSGDTIGIAGHLSVQSRVVANLFAGSGASLSALSATAITTGTVATARLGSGTANSSTFLRGDNTWATPPGGSGSGVTGSGTLGNVARFADVDQIEDARIQDSASLTTFLNPSVFSSAVTINGALAVAGAAALNGNVTLGDAGTDTLTLTARVASNIESNANTYQVGTSGQPFNRVYLGGTTPGLYVSGTRVVGSQDTGWGLMAGTDLKDASIYDIDEILLGADFDAARGAIAAVARQVRAIVSALSTSHGLLGA